MAGEKSTDNTTRRIQSKDAIVGVVGLGYVGLPLTLAFAEKFQVIGFEADPERRKMLNAGVSYIDDVSDTTLKKVVGSRLKIAEDPAELTKADVLIICVPTPLDSRGNPDMSYVRDGANIVRKVVRRGMLVVLESTSYPGTTEEYLGRAITDTGLEPGRDVALAFSPERVDPGNKKYGIANTPKIVGGIDESSTNLAAELYSTIIEAGVIRMKDCRTAEAVKILENIFRGVNIALMNEMALIFEKMGINTWEVIEGAASKPFAFIPHLPGPGVGGHCIPLDPMYLSYKAKQYGFVPRFIELSHEVNEFMKHHTVNLTMRAIEEAGLDPHKATVAVMGLAYKKNISDTRESPAISIIDELSKRVGKLLVHDPRVSRIETQTDVFTSSSLDEVLAEAHCLVFVTDHDEFRSMDVDRLRGKQVQALVDTRNIFPRDQVRSAGLVYVALGKPS